MAPKRRGSQSLLFGRELTGSRRQDLLSWSREVMYDGEGGRLASYIPLPETAKSTIALAFSADGEYFASTHGDHTVKVRAAPGPPASGWQRTPAPQASRLFKGEPILPTRRCSGARRGVSSAFCRGTSARRGPSSSTRTTIGSWPRARLTNLCASGM